MLTLMYLALAVLGAGYVLFAALLGHLADAFDGGTSHGEAGQASDGDAGAYGLGHEGHGATHATGVDASAFHFPFFSPLALATLFGSLGAWGLITKYGVGVRDAASLALSIPLAVGTAYLVTYAAWRLVRGSQGTSAIRLADLVGAAAEVLTPIPAGGAGEVAATVAGQRFTGPAREAQGREVGRGASVTVVRVVGATLVVSATDGTRGATP
jgi:membrane protein implicated in regulation of membrane protease activity